VAGTWIQRAHIRRTDAGPFPADLKPDERWIDVDLSAQTLVAFVGQKPIYATLISSGKESKIEEKDHRTPRGEWRVREKHITTTMDGDGSAAGDLPYSIEDVPYVMYYHRSYATHGAFWHANYGVQMSHGCVNLSPLDAKYLFFFADPPIPAGFHGVWATDAQPGTRIVIHD
jgi:lipoprotein-anchoring transpeptidase ErfK/SrfK